MGRSFVESCKETGLLKIWYLRASMLLLHYWFYDWPRFHISTCDILLSTIEYISIQCLPYELEKNLKKPFSLCLNTLSQD